MFRNESLVNASIGLPQSKSTVNVTYVGEPDSPRVQYKIKFVDPENSKYTCDMRQRSDEVMVTVCRKKVSSLNLRNYWKRRGYS